MNYELIYQSNAIGGISEEEILKLLNKSIDYNENFGITGCLLFHHSEFLQILEGDKKDIKTLFERIKKDPRHSDIKVIWEGEIEHRKFANWKMAFKSLSNYDMAIFKNYLNVENLSDLVDVFYKTLLNVTEKKAVARILFDYINREVIGELAED